MEEKKKTLHKNEMVRKFSEPKNLPPFWIQAVGKSNCDSNYRIIRQESKVCVCEYIIKGSGTLCVGGEILHPQAGDIYILPEFENHEYYTNPDDPWVKIFFNIRGVGVSSLLSLFDIKKKYLFPNCEDLQPLFEAFLMKSKEDISDEQMIIEGSKTFFHLLYAIYNKEKTMDQTLGEAQIAKKFIENNIDRQITLEEIAESIYRSKDYTNKLFKHYYKQTAYAYYNYLRTEKAKALLLHSTLTVGEIAEKLGYNNGKSFSRYFCRMTGMSASEYRRISHGTHVSTETIRKRREK